ncbi:MAG: AAA family ATPase [Chloroflexi bacterium]|nr:AAA family ATPase [Chloroflexota bacterium]
MADNWGIVGHERAVAMLSRGLAGGRLAHGYLFAGPPGIGKATLALRLAAALNCRAPERPCLACHTCRRILTGKHPDVQVVGVLADEKTGKARRDISIEQIWAVQRSAGLAAYEGGARVAVFDGAEQLSLPAANALLKTLEEPPAGVYLILLTVAPDTLLPTIHSRCQRVDLHPVAEPVLVRALVDRFGVTLEQARLLARVGGGRPGWAIAALADPKVIAARAERLTTAADLAAADRVARFQAAETMAGRFSRDRQRVLDELAEWSGWWRDLLLTRAGRVDLATNFDRAAELTEQAGQLDLRAIAMALRAIAETQTYLRQNVSPRLALETLMLRLPVARR